MIVWIVVVGLVAFGFVCGWADYLFSCYGCAFAVDLLICLLFDADFGCVHVCSACFLFVVGGFMWTGVVVVRFWEFGCLYLVCLMFRVCFSGACELLVCDDCVLGLMLRVLSGTICLLVDGWLLSVVSVGWAGVFCGVGGLMVGGLLDCGLL